jgi:hypothetical protein
VAWSFSDGGEIVDMLPEFETEAAENGEISHD